MAEEIPDTRYYTNYFILPLTRRSEIAVFRSIDKISVGRINISLPENTAISVGWIIAQYGQPYGITLYARSQMITLRYPFMVVNTMMEDWRVVANATVMSFFIHDPHFQLKVYTNPCIDRMSSRDAVNRAWRGFTNVYIYLFRDFQSTE